MRGRASNNQKKSRFGFEELIKLYEKYKEKYKEEVFKYISVILKEAKEEHKKEWEKNPTPNRDHEQSWRAFKGKNFEKLVLYIIKDEVERLGLKVIDGNTLERTNYKKLNKELSQVKRNLLVDYGKFGYHMPDVDIIIYEPETLKILAVISSKITLRDWIAQTGYWKLKFLQDEVTREIKVFFVTTDEDGTLKSKSPAKKGRAIVEVDTDGGYVMNEEEIEESEKVKKFDKFIDDLKRIVTQFKKGY